MSGNADNSCLKLTKMGELLNFTYELIGRNFGQHLTNHLLDNKKIPGYEIYEISKPRLTIASWNVRALCGIRWSEMHASKGQQS